MANDLQLIILKHFRKELATIISIQLEDSSKSIVSNSVAILENFLNKRFLRDDKKLNYFALEIDSKDSDVFLLKSLKIMRVNGWAVLSSHVLESLAFNSLVNNIETTFYLEKSINVNQDDRNKTTDSTAQSNHRSAVGVAVEASSTSSIQRRASIAKPTDSHPLQDGHSVPPYRTSITPSSSVVDDSKSSLSATAPSTTPLVTNSVGSSVTSGKLYQKFLTRRASLKATPSESPFTGGGIEIQSNRVDAATASTTSGSVRQPVHPTPLQSSAVDKPSRTSSSDVHPSDVGDVPVDLLGPLLPPRGSSSSSSISTIKPNSGQAKPTAAAASVSSPSPLNTASSSTADDASSFFSSSSNTPTASSSAVDRRDTASASSTTSAGRDITSTTAEAPVSVSKAVPGVASGVRTMPIASAVIDGPPTTTGPDKRSQEVPNTDIAAVDVDMVKSSINPLSSLSKVLRSAYVCDSDSNCDNAFISSLAMTMMTMTMQARKPSSVPAPSQQVDQHEIEKINHFSKLGSAFFGGNSLRRGNAGRGSMQREQQQPMGNHGHG